MDERSRPIDGLWYAALFRYLGVVAAGNAAWEFAHLPLYTIWTESGWRENIFAAVHCAGGDILIALSTLTAALLLVGNPRWPIERFAHVAVVAILAGVIYTGFSEYLNIEIRGAWAYSELMPTITIYGFELGLSPILQWIIVPLGAFAFAAPPYRREARLRREAERCA